jgi:AraC family transcriptional regulator
LKKKRDAERLQRVLLESLDVAAETPDLARSAFQSRTQFHRLFRALLAETPGAMRRRLLLERAAWRLGRTGDAVTEVALDAQYGSLEAFTRAFRKAFGVSPSLYRRMGISHFRLAGASGVHFLAAGSISKGKLDMDLFDRFAGYETWHTRKLLEHARQLTDEQLDRPIATPELLPWHEPERSLRELLDRIVFTKEVWTAAMTASKLPELKRRLSPAEMLARYDEADGEFQRLLCAVDSRGGWDDTFVDELCEPPEEFTFGGMLTHLITFNSYRRLTAASLLRSLGVDNVGFGDPIEYEREATARLKCHIRA